MKKSTRKSPTRAKTSLYLNERTKAVLNMLCDHFNIKTKQATMEFIIMRVARDEGLELPKDTQQ